jgi:hypothetical protein
LFGSQSVATLIASGALQTASERRPTFEGLREQQINVLGVMRLGVIRDD